MDNKTTIIGLSRQAQRLRESLDTTTYSFKRLRNAIDELNQLIKDHPYDIPTHLVRNILTKVDK